MCEILTMCEISSFDNVIEGEVKVKNDSKFLYRIRPGSTESSYKLSLEL